MSMEFFHILIHLINTYLALILCQLIYEVLSQEVCSWFAVCLSVSC